MAVSAQKDLDNNLMGIDKSHLSDDIVSDASDTSEGFLYDMNTKPTLIEKIFGEPYHVSDKYSSHRISLRFVITLFFVYFVEGCLDWMMIAMRYYGTAIWNIGPSDMQDFRSITSLPWTFKLIYGLMIDTITLCGYKRKSWMFVFGLLGPLSVLVIIIWSKYYQVQLIFMTINAVSVAFCDVIADALTVERTEFKSHTVATRLQSLAWGSRYISSIAGLLISTRIELSQKPKDMLIVYWLYFFISCSIVICSLLLPEKRITKNRNINEMELVHDNEEEHVQNENVIENQSHNQGSSPSYSVKEILYLTFETICRKSIFYPLLFTFILRCTPTSDEAMDYFLIYKLGFSSIWIGYIRIVAGVAFLLSIAIIMYQSRKSNHNFSLRRLYFIWTLIATILPFMTLIIIFGWNQKIGIPNIYFMLSDKVVVATAGDILQMAMNVLYARICPPGIEGVFMTVLTSISNVGLVINYQISSKIITALGIKCDEDPNDTDSVICDFKYLWLLIIIVNLTTLIPLILIKKVPDEHELQKIGDELKNATDEQIDVNGDNVDRKEMVKVYGITIDYIFPFFKHKICCCLCNNNKDNRSKLNQHMIANNNDNNKTNSNDNVYAEIEMR